MKCGKGEEVTFLFIRLLVNSSEMEASLGNLPLRNTGILYQKCPLNVTEN